MSNKHLQDWLGRATFDERERVATAAGTSVGYLWQLAGSHRKASPLLAAELQKASVNSPAGQLTVAGLRPDLQLLLAASGRSKTKAN